MPRRQILKLNLSEHTLDIRYKRSSWENSQLDLDEIDDYLKALVTDKDGFREYQYTAIRDILFYLWADKYNSVKYLAKENWREKPSIQQRFSSEEHFLSMLPLPDKLSGVVHMATGTGKSYVIFAVAYLSILLGFVKRVLVLGPSSTVIEEGLWAKFKEHIFGERGQELINKLPPQYRNIPVKLLNETQPIEDCSITIENINAIFNKDRNAIGDTMFSNTDEVLVLSDEVHHAYSHLNFQHGHFEIESGGTGETRNERIWMTFLRTEPKIKRHIGFTGTPYMSTSSTDQGNAYFTDVIYNYSIKDATDEKFIKIVNPIIHTEADEDYKDLLLDQRFEMILDNHEEYKRKYSYSVKGKARVKPITIFICMNISSAQKSFQDFINFLAKVERKKSSAFQSLTYYHAKVGEKVMCATSEPGDVKYSEELKTIEDLNNKKEFIFSVYRLSEGWDVDNVFQIVPMKDTAFNSKLRISQVLGRGLRLPRKVEKAILLSNYPENYPVVTITNHEKFATHIKELVDSVTMCETRITSRVIKDKIKSERSKYNFTLFNINYIPKEKFIEKSQIEQTGLGKRTLILDKPKGKLGLKVTYDQGLRQYELTNIFHTVDYVTSELVQRFRVQEYEQKHFNFGFGIELVDLPTNEDIEKVIRKAMKRSGFKDDKLSDLNRQQINLFFSQFLPKSKKKRIFENSQGSLLPISTINMDNVSIRTTDLEKEAMAYISDGFEKELPADTLFIIKELEKKYQKDKGKEKEGQGLLFAEEDSFIQKNSEFVNFLYGANSPVVVNSAHLKTSLDVVFTSHNPEKEFLFMLLRYAEYFESWVKSRDIGFYSVDFEYWKKGKDRKKGSFNPDFFIKQNLDSYINLLEEKNSQLDLSRLRQLQDDGVESLIRVVEIKSDEDADETTTAKEEYAKQHFKLLNESLKSNPMDVEEKYRIDFYQHYTFDLLRPFEFPFWFSNLEIGELKLKI